MNRLRLTRFQGFLLVSAALIAIVVTASGFIVGGFFAHYVRSHEEQHVAKIVQVQAIRHLVAGNFRPTPSATGTEIFDAFRRELPEVFRIKVYDKTGRIVWSDEPRLIGLKFPDDALVERALRGKVSSAFHHPGASENIYEWNKGHVTETYVPIVLPGSDSVVGVIETYKDVSQLALAIQRRQRRIWAIAAGMGALLYVALALVVWKASESERRAIGELELQNRQQSLLREFSSALLVSLDPQQLADVTARRIGIGLGLLECALYRCGPLDEVELLGRWSAAPGQAPLPPLQVDVEHVIAEGTPVMRGPRVLLPITAPGASPPRLDNSRLTQRHVFAAVFPRTVRDVPVVLEIMLNEAAIVLANAELFTAIRDAHERLAAIMAGIADRMIIIDRDMTLVWQNAVASEAHRAGDRALGSRCYEALGQQPETCQTCPAIRTLASGQVERGVRMERRAQGGVRYLDLVTAPLRDGSGEVREVLEVARDITELVELEERLKEFTARLEESHGVLLAKTEELERTNNALREAQAQLVSRERMAAVAETIVGLHHAILNPLTGILGTLQVLRVGDLTPEAKVDALEQAEAEARKIAAVVHRVAAMRQATGTPYVGGTTMLDLGTGARADDS